MVNNFDLTFRNAFTLDYCSGEVKHTKQEELMKFKSQPAWCPVRRV